MLQGITVWKKNNNQDVSVRLHYLLLYSIALRVILYPIIYTDPCTPWPDSLHSNLKVHGQKMAKTL